MSSKVTLEQVEQLAARLSPKEQLKLFSRLSEQLTEVISQPASVSKRKRGREATAILREFDRVAVAFTRKTDSAETIRRLRDERHRQICQSKS
jgi:hypothetical protein